jgi:hypothetical protein
MPKAVPTPKPRSKPSLKKSINSTPPLPPVADIEIKVVLSKVPSLNQFYASKHWIVRKKAKDKFTEEVLAQLATYDKTRFQTITATLRHNYGYDNDNCIMAIKFALDALRKWGGIQDDNTNFVTKVTISRDHEIEKNTGQVIFFGKGVVC